jgi:hypothetical protein
MLPEGCSFIQKKVQNAEYYFTDIQQLRGIFKIILEKNSCGIKK